MKYHAFISYSHKDAKWGRWLHRAIETYRVPRRVRNDLPDAPARLFPVFRDRDELPTSANLADSIREALTESRFLIVVCSPDAAASRWVNEEVKTYKQLGGAGRILCLIVAGEPNADDKPGGDSATECFPPALKYEVGADGTLTERRTEPIAADVRPGGDGKHAALLKIVAPLLGVGFETLRRRDLERQRRRAAMLSAASIVLVGAFAFIALRAIRAERSAVTAQHLATAKRAESDYQLALNLFSQSQVPRALTLLAGARPDLSPELGKAADMLLKVWLPTLLPFETATGTAGPTALSWNGHALIVGTAGVAEISERPPISWASTTSPALVGVLLDDRTAVVGDARTGNVVCRRSMLEETGSPTYIDSAQDLKLLDSRFIPQSMRFDAKHHAFAVFGANEAQYVGGEDPLVVYVSLPPVCFVLADTIPRIDDATGNPIVPSGSTPAKLEYPREIEEGRLWRRTNESLRPAGLVSEWHEPPRTSKNALGPLESWYKKRSPATPSTAGTNTVREDTSAPGWKSWKPIDTSAVESVLDPGLSPAQDLRVWESEGHQFLFAFSVQGQFYDWQAFELDQRGSLLAARDFDGLSSTDDYPRVHEGWLVVGASKQYGNWPPFRLLRLDSLRDFEVDRSPPGIGPLAPLMSPTASTIAVPETGAQHVGALTTLAPEQEWIGRNGIIVYDVDKWAHRVRYRTTVRMPPGFGTRASVVLANDSIIVVADSAGVVAGLSARTSEMLWMWPAVPGTRGRITLVRDSSGVSVAEFGSSFFRSFVAATGTPLGRLVGLADLRGADASPRAPAVIIEAAISPRGDGWIRTDAGNFSRSVFALSSRSLVADVERRTAFSASDPLGSARLPHGVLIQVGPQVSQERKH